MSSSALTCYPGMGTALALWAGFALMPNGIHALRSIGPGRAWRIERSHVMDAVIRLRK
jgi:hypothetical protein